MWLASKLRLLLEWMTLPLLLTALQLPQVCSPNGQRSKITAKNTKVLPVRHGVAACDAELAATTAHAGNRLGRGVYVPCLWSHSSHSAAVLAEHC